MEYIDGANYLIEYDKDIENFIYASGINNPNNLDVGGIYTTDQAMAYVAALVSGIKSIGVWDKLKALYPIVGGTPFTHSFNLKDPQNLDTSFRIQWEGNIIHNAMGIKANASFSYGNTFYKTSDNDGDYNFIGLYINQDGIEDTGVQIEMGAGDMGYYTFMSTRFSQTDRRYFAGINTNNAFVSSFNDDGKGSYTQYTNTNIYGDTIQNGMKNGIKFPPNYSLNVKSTQPIYILTRNEEGIANINYSRKRMSLAYIGNQILSDDEAVKLNYIVSFCQGILNRK